MDYSIGSRHRMISLYSNFGSVSLPSIKEQHSTEKECGLIHTQCVLHMVHARTAVQLNGFIYLFILMSVLSSAQHTLIARI